MNRDLAAVLMSSVIATFNPSLIAAVSVMLMLPHPKRLMLGYLLGAYATSLLAGLVIVHSLQRSHAITGTNHSLSSSEDIGVGAALFAVAFLAATRRDSRLQTWRAARKQAKARARPAKRPWQQRMLGRGSALVAFAVGAAVSLPGVSYLNALDHIVKLNPPIVPTLLLISYFCVMQQILLELPLLAYSLAPERAQTAMTTLKAWINHRGRLIAVIVLTTLGALLAAHGILAAS